MQPAQKKRKAYTYEQKWTAVRQAEKGTPRKECSDALPGLESPKLSNSSRRRWLDEAGKPPVITSTMLEHNIRHKYLIVL